MQFSDHIKIHSIAILFLFLSNFCRAQPPSPICCAPITTGSIQTTCPGTAITIPVTVTGFSNIGGITLRILYNSTVMSFTSGNANPAITAQGGVAFNSVPVNDTTNALKITWTTSPNPPNNLNLVTLPDNSVLFTIGFNYISGNTAFSFDNTNNGGTDCEYSTIIILPPPDYFSVVPLIDTPTSTYYHDGQLSSPPGPRTWTGNVSTDWSNSNNWNPCGVPRVTDDITVPAAPSNKPIVNASGFGCHNILVKTGSKLTVNPGVLLTITGTCTIEP